MDDGVSESWGVHPLSPNSPLAESGRVIAWSQHEPQGEAALTQVHSIELESGDDLWSYPLGSEHTKPRGRFATVDGTLYIPEWVGANTATLHAVSRDDGERAWAVRVGLREWDELAADLRGVYFIETETNGLALVAIDVSDGVQSASTSLSNYEVLFRPFVTDRGVLVFTRHEVLLFESGTLILENSYPVDAEVVDDLMPVVNDRYAVFWKDTNSYDLKRLVGLDLEDGSMVEASVERAVHSELSDGYVWVPIEGRAGHPGGFQSVSLTDGSESVFTYEWLADEVGPKLAVDANYLARWSNLEGSEGVVVFDIRSGLPVCEWIESDSFVSDSLPVVVEGRVLVPASGQLVALRLP